MLWFVFLFEQGGRTWVDIEDRRAGFAAVRTLNFSLKEIAVTPINALLTGVAIRLASMGSFVPSFQAMGYSLGRNRK